MRSAENLRLRRGILERVVEKRPGATVWEARLEDEPSARAIAYDGLTGELREGGAVLLNTAAAALGLGTGGYHFIVSALDAADAPFEGAEAGHLMKLRYTPLQHRVLAVEDEASPHREAYDLFQGLQRIPVLCAELHSQMAASAIAAHAVSPSLRIVYVMTDSASLPIGFSRLVHALREQGVLSAAVTTGQAFGGDYEAVNVHSGLVAAKAVAQADLALVAQGPGNVGTASQYGFSGLSLLEAIHAAEALGGQPLLVPRISFAEGRERHRALSHHTAALLRLARCGVEMPLPALPQEQADQIKDQVMAADPDGRHSLRQADPAQAWSALRRFEPALTSMGRSVEQDSAFFLTAAAGGVRAAELAATVKSGTSR